MCLAPCFCLSPSCLPLFPLLQLVFLRMFLLPMPTRVSHSSAPPCPPACPIHPRACALRVSHSSARLCTTRASGALRRTGGMGVAVLLFVCFPCVCCAQHAFPPLPPSLVLLTGCPRHSVPPSFILCLPGCCCCCFLCLCPLLPPCCAGVIKTLCALSGLFLLAGLGHVLDSHKAAGYTSADSTQTPRQAPHEQAQLFVRCRCTTCGSGFLAVVSFMDDHYHYCHSRSSNTIRSVCTNTPC